MSSRSRRDDLKDQSGSYLPRICAIIFAVFDPAFGPTVLHQIPEGSVATALSIFEGRKEGITGVGKEGLEGVGVSGGGIGAGGGVGMVKETSGQGEGNTTQVLFDFSSGSSLSPLSPRLY